MRCIRHQTGQSIYSGEDVPFVRFGLHESLIDRRINVYKASFRLGGLALLGHDYLIDRIIEIPADGRPGQLVHKSHVRE